MVFEDSAATAGLLVAMIGIALYQLTGNPVFDALASVAIGVILVLTAVWLAYESKSLLIGESASPELLAGITEILTSDERVDRVNEIATLHMGPDFIVVTASADFASNLDADTLERGVTELNVAIKSLDPRVQRVFIEAEKHSEHGVSR